MHRDRSISRADRIVRRFRGWMHVVVEDAASAGYALRELHNDEKHMSVGIICVRPVQGEITIGRELAATTPDSAWTFLILHDNENDSGTRADFEATGPIVPVFI